MDDEVSVLVQNVLDLVELSLSEPTSTLFELRGEGRQRRVEEGRLGRGRLGRQAGEGRLGRGGLGKADWEGQAGGEVGAW